MLCVAFAIYTRRRVGPEAPASIDDMVINPTHKTFFAPCFGHLDSKVSHPSIISIKQHVKQSPSPDTQSGGSRIICLDTCTFSARRTTCVLCCAPPPTTKEHHQTIKQPINPSATRPNQANTINSPRHRHPRRPTTTAAPLRAWRRRRPPRGPVGGCGGCARRSSRSR